MAEFSAILEIYVEKIFIFHAVTRTWYHTSFKRTLILQSYPCGRILLLNHTKFLVYLKIENWKKKHRKYLKFKIKILQKWSFRRSIAWESSRLIQNILYSYLFWKLFCIVCWIQMNTNIMCFPTGCSILWYEFSENLEKTVPSKLPSNTSSHMQWHAIGVQCDSSHNLGLIIIYDECILRHSPNTFWEAIALDSSSHTSMWWEDA